MARIEEKTKNNKKVINKVFTGVSIGFLSAVLVAAIVILVLWFVNKNKDDETEFVEKFETAEMIDFEGLAKLLNNDDHSPLLEEYTYVYVYLYSPDYEESDDSTAAYVHENVKDLVEEFQNPQEEYAFFVLNVTKEENAEYLREHSSFLSDWELSSSYPTLLVFGADVKESADYEQFNDYLLKDLYLGITDKKDMKEALNQLYIAVAENE